MIRISARLASTSDLHGVAGEAHDVARAAGDPLADRLQRGLALLLDLEVDALAVEPVLQVGELGVGVVDVAAGRRCWKLETWSEIGLASRKPSPISSASTVTITIPTAAPRGMCACCSSATNGFSSSAISPAMMNSSRIVAGGVQEQVGAGDRQRQQHHLDPARDEHRLDAGRRRRRRRAQRRGVRALLADVVERVRSLLVGVPRHRRCQ